MSDKFEQPLRVLGLGPNATGQAIKEAYLDLVKVWHPDRFGSDARLRAKAQEKLKDVNAAFEQLRGYCPSDSTPSREAVPPVPPTYVPQPAGRHPEKTPPTGVLPLFLFLSALIAFVGAWFFLSGRPAIQQPSPVNEAATPASANQTRVPAVLSRGAAETPSSIAGASAESAAVPATGSMSVGSRPMGARVSFDGQVVGETPIVLTDLTPGEHQIGLDLNAKGYQPWSTSVVVTAGHEEKLLAVMTPKER
jgi:hypothetical protein